MNRPERSPHVPASPLSNLLGKEALKKNNAMHAARGRASITALEAGAKGAERWTHQQDASCLIHSYSKTS